MRLLEVDLGSARDVLAVLKGQANKDQQKSEIPFKAVLNILKPFGLAISTPDGLIALKNEVDPEGSVIKDIKDDGTVVLNTEAGAEQQPEKIKGSGKSTLDQMAKSNSLI